MKEFLTRFDDLYRLEFIGYFIMGQVLYITLIIVAPFNVAIWSLLDIGYLFLLVKGRLNNIEYSTSYILLWMIGLLIPIIQLFVLLALCAIPSAYETNHRNKR